MMTGANDPLDNGPHVQALEVSRFTAFADDDQFRVSLVFFDRLR